MESHWCVWANNTTIDASRYYPQGITSALGISAVTVVCLICIFVDILNGFRKEKPWLPCKYFALNSLTLSLVSLAARYPSDRTTLMLSAEDQLCKLSGTVLVCISMGFFMPSLGSEKGPESIKNMASLTILVVAVEFNVIAQMFTGVIFSFTLEHSVVLFFMFVLLLMLWTVCLEVNYGKGAFNEHKNTHLESLKAPETTDKMLKQLEWFYIFGYTSNPQFLLGLVTHCATIGLMCTLCALALLEATIGTFVVTEFTSCDRSYKSKWGMQMVLGIQILTIIVGISGIGYRWFTMVRHSKPDDTKEHSKPDDTKEHSNPDDSKEHTSRESRYESVYENLYSLPRILSGTCYFNGFRLMEALLTWIMIKMAKGFESITNFILLVSRWLRLGKQRDTEPNSVREEHFRNAIYSQGHKVFVDWIMRRAVQDMGRLVDENKKNPPRDLIQLLLRQRKRCQKELSEFFELYEFLGYEFLGYRVSCLSMVVLVRLVDFVIPSCSSSLKNALNDCFDIVYMIDESICLIEKSTNANDAQDEKRLMLAEDLWMSTNFKCHWFYKKIIEPSIGKCNKESGQSPVAVTLQIIQEIMKAAEKENLRGFDLYVLAKYIMIGHFDSLDELHAFLETLFVKMLYYILGKLPRVVENYVWKSSVEECGDRARYVMKMICKVKQLEDRIGLLEFKIDEGKSPTKDGKTDEGSSICSEE